ncbi:cyclin-I-like [Saccostrea echinata]|uniref:cyclin-I-like n=1 Tax=Saccostrea echinata TaxID=191078 RepID=UPI002A805AE4|nr:cyclin-I-like [Saccostrea echinata]
MESHKRLDARHLMKMLGEHLARCSQWSSNAYKPTGTCDEVLGQQRDKVVGWILSLNAEFRFTPETLGLAICLLDRFLNLIKVRPKYLPCVAICCLYIAAKTLEEDEVIPSTKDLVKTIRCVCSVAEILRMEAIILDKLSWNVKQVTAVDLLLIIHGLLMCYYPKLLDGLSNLTPSQHLSMMMRKIFHCLGNHQLAVFSPISLVLSIVSLELEQITPNWFSIVNTVQQVAEVNNQTFFRCREVTGLYLSKHGLLPSGYQFRVIKRSKSIKRKAVDDEEEDLYDGIKRLYSEDAMDTTASVRKSCSSEMVQHQDTDGRNSFLVAAVSAN